VLLCTSFVANAQTDTQVSVPPLEVKVTKDLQKIYVHKLKPKETLFKLSRVFDLPVVYLEKINQIQSGAILGVGSEIIIPVKEEIISSQKKHETDVPVVYQVRQRETIFRISRIYFDKQIEDIKHLNKLEDLQLDIDQILQIGWIDLRDPKAVNNGVVAGGEPIQQPTIDVQTPQLEGTSEEKLDSTEVIAEEILDFETPTEDAIDSSVISDEIQIDSIITVIEEVDSITIEPEKVESPAVPPTYKRGIAYWNKSSQSSELFVMHDEAKVNTQIELYNPLVNKRIIATVVARIPGNAYPEDINLVLSPAVARNLGAFDSRFYVEMKYYK
jgi:hypothetical protein